jgi:hypothetical protein
VAELVQLTVTRQTLPDFEIGRPGARVEEVALRELSWLLVDFPESSL